MAHLQTIVLHNTNLPYPMIMWRRVAIRPNKKEPPAGFAAKKESLPVPANHGYHCIPDNVVEENGA